MNSRTYSSWYRFSRQNVMNQAAEKGDVRPGANLDEAIGDGRRPVEARIDAHELRVAIPLRVHDEAEPHRMVLGRVAAHGQHDVRITDVGPPIGHRAAAERGGQTGHRRAVSYSGLLLDREDAEARAERLHEEVVDLVGVGAAADHAGRRQAVDGLARGVLPQSAGYRASASGGGQCDRWRSPRSALPTRRRPARGRAPWSGAGR